VFVLIQDQFGGTEILVGQADREPPGVGSETPAASTRL
jgi:hypothetical protein